MIFVVKMVCGKLI
ncbi:hypothetical protein K6U64_05725 [Vibrio vulnificus]|nr:hypothetical protein [Vibrio vulnificus]